MKRAPLRCPDCGDFISVTREWRGRTHLSEQVVTGFECDDFRCGAAWDIAGDPL